MCVAFCDADCASPTLSHSLTHSLNLCVSLILYVCVCGRVHGTTVATQQKLLHDAPRIVRGFLPEAGMTLLVGMVAGFFVNLYADSEEANSAATYDNNNNHNNNNDDAMVDMEVAETLLSFSPSVFFVALLPPIIFNSGYHLRRALFFRSIVPISLLACVGTTVSALCIALLLQVVQSFGLTGSFQPTFTELLTFGGLISATDPVSTLAVFQAKRVDPQLFYLVFGESVLNDAVGLVLFNSFAAFVRRHNEIQTVAVGVVYFFVDFSVSFVGSLLLGLLAGIVSAFVLKIVDVRSSPLIELSIFVLIMYVPYMLAEILNLSGIVTILFTGMAARRFVVPNLSDETVANADVLFRLAAHVAETSIFLELGMSVFGFSGGGAFVWQFVLWSLLACLVGRAVNVYPIVLLHNSLLGRRQQQQQQRQDESTTRVNQHQLPPSRQQTSGRQLHDGIVRDKGHDTGHTNNESLSNTGRSFANGNNNKIPKSDPNLAKRIPIRTAHMVWFSGLRGAVAYACVRTFPNTFHHRKQFVITTMTIVLVTVFFMGGATESVLKVLRIDTNVDEDLYMALVGNEHRESLVYRIGESSTPWRCLDVPTLWRFVLSQYRLNTHIHTHQQSHLYRNGPPTVLVCLSIVRPPM